MKKIMLIGVLVSAMFGCNSPCDSNLDFDTTTSDMSNVEQECPPCSEALFGSVMKDDLCHDSNLKFARLQASVCQEGQVNLDKCIDSICLGQPISYPCFDYINNNAFLDGNGIYAQLLNAQDALNNLHMCEYDSGGK